MELQRCCAVCWTLNLCNYNSSLTSLCCLDDTDRWESSRGRRAEVCCRLSHCRSLLSSPGDTCSTDIRHGGDIPPSDWPAASIHGVTVRSILTATDLLTAGSVATVGTLLWTLDTAQINCVPLSSLQPHLVAFKSRPAVTPASDVVAHRGVVAVTSLLAVNVECARRAGVGALQVLID